MADQECIPVLCHRRAIRSVFLPNIFTPTYFYFVILTTSIAETPAPMGRLLNCLDPPSEFILQRAQKKHTGEAEATLTV